tara:strand:+ start:7497 stop:8015 length:519 start_codon:yes stop_codon:yes gene_type:complete
MLEKIGYKPSHVFHPNIDERILEGETPYTYVSRLAEKKANSALGLYKNSYILGADTIIFSGNKVIGKPKNYEDAYNILTRLSGKRHSVYGGICLISPSKNTSIRTVVTKVKFRFISSKEIQEYLSTDEWKDKAGCYAIQGYAAKFVKNINGNYDNVMGLSLVDFDSMIRGLK